MPDGLGVIALCVGGSSAESVMATCVPEPGSARLAITGTALVWDTPSTNRPYQSKVISTQQEQQDRNVITGSTTKTQLCQKEKSPHFTIGFQLVA